MIRPRSKERLHPRNRFRKGYDFAGLVKVSEALGAFVRPNAYGEASIDYADPRAVMALNQALLKQAYGIDTWDVPAGYLCPPIPGRSDYIHYLADLLGDGRSIPRGASVRGLDIGVGASCIYPLIGASEYGWRFVGSDVDPAALRSAGKIAAGNPAAAPLIECRRQPSAKQCFKDVILKDEFFDVTLCNPPFHASAAEAASGSERKRRNLGSADAAGGARNFGGQSSELWCPGGEAAFVRRMIAESAGFALQCGWFTTLVSKSAHLPRLYEALRRAKVTDVRTIGMAQGQKQSRILAWTFRPVPRRAARA